MHPSQFSPEAWDDMRAIVAYIVTRDKDLLSLQHYEDITMITPEAFIGIVREQEASKKACGQRRRHQ